MDRTRTLRANAVRAFWDTLENIWFDVKLSCGFTIVFALLSYQQGLPIAKVTLLSLVAWVAVFLLAYLVHFLRVAHHPERNSKWIRSETEVWKNETPVLRLAIEPTEPMYVGRNVCEITVPDGTVWMEHNPQEKPKAVRGLGVYYPRDFPGAPPLTSGPYKVRWFVGWSGTKWREILRFEVPVDLG
jgi:hypothetical protein